MHTSTKQTLQPDSGMKELRHESIINYIEYNIHVEVWNDFFLCLIQGPCCSNDCSFKTGELKCRDNNGCRAESFCDGKSPECPMSELKPNKTVCNKEFVCYKGVSFKCSNCFYQTNIKSFVYHFQFTFKKLSSYRNARDQYV